MSSLRIIKEIGRNPNIDWITTLVVSVAIILSLGFADFTLYNDVVNGSIQGTAETAGSSYGRINERAIESAISRFEHKEEIYTKVLGGYTGYGDPSVPGK